MFKKKKKEEVKEPNKPLVCFTVEHDGGSYPLSYEMDRVPVVGDIIFIGSTVRDFRDKCDNYHYRVKEVITCLNEGIHYQVELEKSKHHD